MTVGPKISVVMVDGSFRERFESIDYFGRQHLPRADYELIWVEYYDRSPADLTERLRRYPNFRHITLGRTGEYHSSYCFNHGILEARGEIICIPDADVIVEPNFLQTVWRDHAANDQLVEYFHRHNEPESEHREPIELDHLKRVCRITNPANHGACVTVRKKWLLEINGYDQHPLFATGFHANDKDVYARLNNLGLLVRWHPTTKLYHAWHPNTGVADARYRPQHDAIHWRGQSQTTLPFDGIDSARNVPVPPQIQASYEWLKALEMTKAQRAIAKVRRTFAGVLQLTTQPAPVAPSHDEPSQRRAA